MMINLQTGIDFLFLVVFSEAGDPPNLHCGFGMAGRKDAEHEH
jgi:hypothetical protein